MWRRDRDRYAERRNHKNINGDRYKNMKRDRYKDMNRDTCI